MWHAVVEETGLQPERTLFIDDSEPILDSAAAFGIRYCLGVTNPDSGTAEKLSATSGAERLSPDDPSLTVKETP